MKRSGWHRGSAKAALVVAVIAVQQNGALAMADGRVKLSWQWRASRALNQRAALRVESVKAEKGGLFGTLNLPSLGGFLQDPMNVQSVVIAVNRPGPAISGSRLTFRIPKLELKGASKGNLVAIGIVGQSIVCVMPAPEGMTDEAIASWLPHAPCD